MQENHFTAFCQSIEGYDLPERFTFPFCYQPHPLCELAAKELQQHLATHTDWQHDFGVVGDSEAAIGKMFGVLLVQNTQGEVGYLSAFSGKIADSNHHAKFVPPVFDSLAEDGFFRTKLATITELGEQISLLEAAPELKQLGGLLEIEETAAKKAIQAHRTIMIEGRRQRKAKRTKAENTDNFLQIRIALGKQSVQHKNELRDLIVFWDARLALVKKPFNQLTDAISELKKQRKNLSANLQQKLFDQYHFLNQQGIEKSLCELFQDTPQQTPPAGAGECAGPKLLQYAFKMGMKPLAMAEFWWGRAPQSQIRQHQNFYAACKGKCQPILNHMLAGIEMDDNPFLQNPAAGKTLEIVYQDEVMVVINKPTEFLSVPGKEIEDSVYLRMKQAYPEAEGPLIVHRLDMSTSGLMVIALNKKAHKNLQQQFIQRTVEKRYIALLEGLVEADKGTVNLPIRVDLDDRPRQLVCYEYGKSAETDWKVIARRKGKTKVYFYPKTGRTHQLRVHAAHINGLNTPIVGDDLYGKQAERLYLHAEKLVLDHPVTKDRRVFQAEVDF